MGAMLFRNSFGKLINIERSAFSTDTAYYREIMRCKNIQLESNHNVIDDMTRLIKLQK